MESWRLRGWSKRKTCKYKDKTHRQPERFAGKACD
jgi:hypothetical protein